MTAAADAVTPFAAELPVLSRVRTPRPLRWFARLLFLGFLLSPVALAVVPWQQTVRGRGQLIAYDPTRRKQILTAQVSGRVGHWHVVEGSRVKPGDPIVDIDDNDAGLTGRLEAQREFLLSRRAAAKEESGEQARTVGAAEKAAAAAVAAARANLEAAAKMVDVARQAKSNAEFAYTFEAQRFEMLDGLFKKGLEPGLNRDEAKTRADRGATDVKRAEAEVKRAAAAVLTGEANVLQAEAAGLSAVALARRDFHRVEQTVFGVERELQDLDNRIERFKARFVKAPVAGTVFRVLAEVGEGGHYVKEGDELAVVVPDAADRVVELFVDGVDAPLVAAHMDQTGRGPHVRLQFEGWPAVQFTGWPSAATGTFGGRVRQIDPTDDGNGRFRILIEPDEAADGDAWPAETYLRQGNQAVGWVFLNRVTLGYELWRTFNGFPPVVAPKSPEKKGKPPKVKPG